MPDYSIDLTPSQIVLLQRAVTIAPQKIHQEGNPWWADMAERLHNASQTQKLTYTVEDAKVLGWALWRFIDEPAQDAWRNHLLDIGRDLTKKPFPDDTDGHADVLSIMDRLYIPGNDMEFICNDPTE